MQVLKSKFFYKKDEEIQTLNTNAKKTDKIVELISYTLMLIGIVMVISASYGATKVYSVSSTHFIFKHLIFCSISLFCIRFFSSKGNWLDKIGTYTWIISIIGLIVVLAFPSIKGANRWISILGISIQPAEFCKIGAILQGAKYLEKNWEKFFAAYLIPIFLLLLQPDLGTSILLIAFACAQIMTKRFNIKYIIISFFSFIVLISSSYFLFNHVRLRINVFLNPSADLYGAGYQLHKSILSIKSGGFFGRGFGKGIIKDFLPDAHTDFVFSVLSEEFGILGGLFLIFLFVSLGLRILKLQPEDEYFSLVQYTLLISILAQTWLNIASTLALIPAKGLTLPLVSYGGSSLIAQGIIFGILLATSKSSKTFSFAKITSYIKKNKN